MPQFSQIPVGSKIRLRNNWITYIKVVKFLGNDKHARNIVLEGENGKLIFLYSYDYTTWEIVE